MIIKKQPGRCTKEVSVLSAEIAPEWWINVFPSYMCCAMKCWCLRPDYSDILSRDHLICFYSVFSFFNNLIEVNNFQTGAAQCLGEIYRLFGRKITAGLIETSSIVAKLMKYHEVICFPHNSVIVIYLFILVSSVNLTVHNSLFFIRFLWNLFCKL